METRQLTEHQQWLDAYPVMKQLRPDLADANEFAERVSRMITQQYQLLGAFEVKDLIGLAGYRIEENLLYGKFLYVDDLVITESKRDAGYGGKLLKAVMAIAKQQNCIEFVLDTGLWMAEAQRFYFSQGLLTQAIRFRQSIKELQ